MTREEFLAAVRMIQEGRPTGSLHAGEPEGIPVKSAHVAAYRAGLDFVDCFPRRAPFASTGRPST